MPLESVWKHEKPCQFEWVATLLRDTLAALNQAVPDGAQHSCGNFAQDVVTPKPW